MNRVSYSDGTGWHNLDIFLAEPANVSWHRCCVSWPDLQERPMKALIDRLGFVPETCVWELTRACNLHCGHCGSAAGKPRANELTTSEAVDLARQLARLGNRLTTLSGGEPSLRHDWPIIARTLIEAGVTVNMVTNGQSDAGQLTQLVKQTGLANVAVSIDGLEASHDCLRARGAYARATNTVRALVEAGVWVDVMLTVNRLNLDEIEGVWRVAQELGAKRFRVQLGKPMGNQTHRTDLTLRPRELLVLLPRLARLATQPGPEVRIGDSIGYFSPEERILRGRYCDQGHWTGCYAGVRAIGIQADGGIKGCLSLQPRADEDDPFVEGNVRQESLESIWRRPSAFAYNRNFRPENLTGACAKCSHALLCRGGASCVAYSFTGALGRDPMCYFEIAGASEETRHRVWPASAPAAAAALVVSFAGCGGESANGSPGTSGGNSAAGGHRAATSVALGGTDARSVSTQSGGRFPVVADYGVIEPSGGTTSSVPKQSSGGVVLAPDYGVILPNGGSSGKSRTSGSGGLSIALDYGVISPKGGATGVGGTASLGSGATNAGGRSSTTSSTAGGQTNSSAADCSNVCCNCEYGIIEPTAFRACCCQAVCCECDYGQPPPGCCS